MTAQELAPFEIDFRKHGKGKRVKVYNLHRGCQHLKFTRWQSKEICIDFWKTPVSPDEIVVKSRAYYHDSYARELWWEAIKAGFTAEP